MRLTRYRVWLFSGLVLLAGCGRDEDAGFCSAHGKRHSEHRDQQAQLLVNYEKSGALSVELTLPGELATLAITDPGDILQVPASCEASALQRRRQPDEVILDFTAACGDVLPESLSVPLLGTHPEVLEIEVSMTTPAVRKHFLIHRDCERALFNIAGDNPSE